MPAALPSRNSKSYVPLNTPDHPYYHSLTIPHQNAKAMNIQCDTCKATFLSTTRENAYVYPSAHESSCEVCN